MASNRQPPPYSKRLTVALFGKRAQLKNGIGKMILPNRPDAFDVTSNSFDTESNKSFKVINTPDFFDDRCLYPDQLIIDFMALSHPGPDLFILAIDSENTQEEKVVTQISKLQGIFGDNITAHLVVTLPDLECFHSLCHLKYRFNTQLAVASENLASECRKWCAERHSFHFNYVNYSEDVVIRRMAAMENISDKSLSYDGHAVCHCGTAGAEAMSPTISYVFAAPANEEAPQHDHGDGAHDSIFNIVLLGLTGTGKSASANTILTAGYPQLDSKHLFKSEPSSMPVTTRCEVKMMEKLFEREVRLVDTPDFFHDQLRNPQEHIDECKSYCKPGQCVVLLVLQLGRFTGIEWGILERLEKKLGWEIRESTIVLLTHGEDLKGNLEKFINAQEHLNNIVKLCGNRYHLFNNTSESKKQVTELIKKIPNYKDLFPKFSKHQNNDCCLC
ncbi:GTPase IMAP family member 8-like [Epinephelus fuscoguttatus]|uniref:GTPase IMAP family member 8-like n=1 Tax=Epinephelus fuscoguttatus TaxID=293821 RepID=UPI0020D0EAFD|nr:GTPase IMAP family member 8-like [Epinephelus fuscoguttatus]